MTGVKINNLAQEMPDKVRDLQRLWLIEAVKYNVLPWMIVWPNG